MAATILAYPTADSIAAAKRAQQIERQATGLRFAECGKCGYTATRATEGELVRAMTTHVLAHHNPLRAS